MKQLDLVTTNGCDSVNYKGEHVPYNGRGHRHYYVRHQYDSILSELRSLVEPFVEVGFDAQQIREELHKQGHTLVLTNNIETVISTILGEQS